MLSCPTVMAMMAPMSEGRETVKTSSSPCSKLSVVVPSGSEEELQCSPCTCRGRRRKEGTVEPLPTLRTESTDSLII